MLVRYTAFVAIYYMKAHAGECYAHFEDIEQSFLILKVNSISKNFSKHIIRMYIIVIICFAHANSYS